MRQRVGDHNTVLAAQESQTIEDRPDRRRDPDAVDHADVTGLQSLLGNDEPLARTHPATAGTRHVNVQVVSAAYVGAVQPGRGEPADDGARWEDKPRRREAELPTVLDIAVCPHSAQPLAPF